MNELNQADLIIGTRQLVAYTGRARTTVRGWIERAVNPLPHTINGSGFKVFVAADVDEWLNAREGGDDDNETDIEFLRQRLLKLKNENAKLELEISKLEFSKEEREREWAPIDEFQAVWNDRRLKIRERTRKFVLEQKKKIPGTTAHELEESDRELVVFFDSLEELTPAHSESTQSTAGGR
jgi:predicted DNA-binding transcriptional regulator AlpA